MTVMVSYIGGFSRLFLDVSSVTETEDGISIVYGPGTETIPHESIIDFRMAIN